MDNRIIQELSEVIQSSNVNIMLGAGVSTPFLPLLGNIEDKLNKARSDAEREIQYKRYFKEVMLPNKKIISNELSSASKYQKTKNAYTGFFQALSEIIIRRKSTILSKQVNLFTTNIDIIMETVLEELQIEYNDGFSGKFNPVFSLDNYKKSIIQRSLHFEHTSEIPVFNIIKIHGSLSWKKDELEKNILFSHRLDHFDNDLTSKKGNAFLNDYKNILIINPEESKLLKSVLDLYYSELLRMYSSELEKENTTLFVVGFSMRDSHIREITLRAVRSNPTLRVFICCSQKASNDMKKRMELAQHQNIQILIPKSKSKEYTLQYMTDKILKKVTLNKLSDK